MIYCIYCGKALEDDAAFCSACGKRVSAEGKNAHSEAGTVIAETTLAAMLAKEKEAPSAELAWQIGDSYFSGTNGAPKDYNEAVRWLEKASSQKHPAAQYALACCYANGIGTEKSDEAAFSLFRAAEANGFTGASLNVAQCFAEGRGVQKNPFRAAVRYIRMITDGDTQAIARLRALYDSGESLASDISAQKRNSHVIIRTLIHEGPGLFKNMGERYNVTDEFDLFAESFIKCRVIPMIDKPAYQPAPSLSFSAENSDFSAEEILFWEKIHNQFHKTDANLSQLQMKEFESVGDSFDSVQPFVLSYMADRMPFSLYGWSKDVAGEPDMEVAEKFIEKINDYNLGEIKDSEIKDKLVDKMLSQASSEVASERRQKIIKPVKTFAITLWVIAGVILLLLVLFARLFL